MTHNVTDNKGSVTDDYTIDKPKEFSLCVQYQRQEYIAIVMEYLSVDNDRPDAPNRLLRALISAFLSLIFWLKMWREGECYFDFKADTLQRRSKSGQSQVSWQKLSKVVALPSAYILVGAKQGMAPIPRRCLTQAQSASLETFAGDKLVRLTS